MTAQETPWTWREGPQPLGLGVRRVTARQLALLKKLARQASWVHLVLPHKTGKMP